MSFALQKYQRKPFTVEAVQVTEGNIMDLSDWCEGEIRNTANGGMFIKVHVHRPMSIRQTRAFVGDWILFSGKGFKVYPDKAFEANFAKVE